MDDTSATIVLLTDCPWDRVLGLAGRDVEQDDLQLTGKILKLCLQNKEISVEQHLVEAARAARADVNHPNSDGDTALHFAACRSDPAFAQLLLERGADAWYRNKLGERPEIDVDGFDTEDSDEESPASAAPASSSSSAA
eukprot:Skav210884  [mRNA]  locus=scaffold3713:91846:94103:+ [translate_table: standard]